ncbi:MAG: EamA family transporter [Candidatus Obscuribacterales bacterium]|nr:EamA family transporter [Steroidobacteraceae bacterium]
MTPVAFALLLTGVLLNAGAQLLLKAGVKTVGEIGLTGGGLWRATQTLAFEPHILGGLACYVISVGVWIVGLSRVDVSIAYPLLSIGYIATAIAAWYLFDEPLTITRIAGIVVIILGVVMITRPT